MPRKMLKPADLEMAFGDVRKTFNHGSDLACAVLGAAYVEKWLGALLRHTFLRDEKFIKQLFGSGGVLETCGAQNDLAYAIELISKQTHRNISLINNIRNEFAHSHTDLKFSDNDISNTCGELIYYHSSRRDLKAFKKNVASDPRKEYCLSCAMTSTCLLATARWTSYSPRTRFMDDSMERAITSVQLQFLNPDES